ncbi:MAG: protein TolR [Gammaproteobacteria bacterium]|nr:MAG: protein TolR [Gammaproteobacteria bacterium]
MQKQKTSPRRKPMSEINVVPYIDVMLVLLVIFMVTAPMITKAVKVDLPDAEAPQLKLDKNQEMVIISVKHDGRYYLNVGKDIKKAKPLEQITADVSKIKKNKPSSPVLVEGDERVAYGVVVKLMAALQQAGVNDVGLVTDAFEQGQ